MDGNLGMDIIEGIFSVGVFLDVIDKKYESEIRKFLFFINLMKMEKLRLSFSRLYSVYNVVFKRYLNIILNL